MIGTATNKDGTHLLAKRAKERAWRVWPTTWRTWASKSRRRSETNRMGLESSKLDAAAAQHIKRSVKVTSPNRSILLSSFLQNKWWDSSFLQTRFFLRSYLYMRVALKNSDWWIANIEVTELPLHLFLLSKACFFFFFGRTNSKVCFLSIQFP